MKAIVLSKLALFFLFVVYSLTSLADDLSGDASDHSHPVTRAEVKRDARTAEASGSIPRGDATFPLSIGVKTQSSVDRAALKAETVTYNKTKQPNWVPTSSYSQSNGSKSVLNRSDVKAQARAAESDQSIQRGDAQTFARLQ